MKNKQQQRMIAELEDSFNSSLVIRDQNDIIGGNTSALMQKRKRADLSYSPGRGGGDIE